MQPNQNAKAETLAAMEIVYKNALQKLKNYFLAEMIKPERTAEELKILDSLYLENLNKQTILYLKARNRIK